MTKLQNAYLSVLSLAGALGLLSGAVSCSESVICTDCGTLNSTGTLLPEDATFAVMSPKKEVRSVFVPKISYSL